MRIAALRALLTKAIYPEDPLLGDLAPGISELFKAKLLERPGTQPITDCRVSAKGMRYIDRLLAVPIDDGTGEQTSPRK